MDEKDSFYSIHQIGMFTKPGFKPGLKPTYTHLSTNRPSGGQVLTLTEK